jgi:hypothetical protein
MHLGPKSPKRRGVECTKHVAFTQIGSKLASLHPSQLEIWQGVLCTMFLILHAEHYLRIQRSLGPWHQPHDPYWKLWILQDRSQLFEQLESGHW